MGPERVKLTEEFCQLDLAAHCRVSDFPVANSVHGIKKTTTNRSAFQALKTKKFLNFLRVNKDNLNICTDYH